MFARSTPFSRARARTAGDASTPFLSPDKPSLRWTSCVIDDPSGSQLGGPSDRGTVEQCLAVADVLLLLSGPVCFLKDSVSSSTMSTNGAPTFMHVLSWTFQQTICCLERIECTLPGGDAPLCAHLNHVSTSSIQLSDDAVVRTCDLHIRLVALDFKKWIKLLDLVPYLQQVLPYGALHSLPRNSNAAQQHW